MVRVREVKLDRDIVVLLVEDKSETCELHVDKYYEKIKQDDILRIRDVSNFNERTVLLNNYSNILCPPNYFFITKQLIGELKNVKKTSKHSLDKLPLTGYSTKSIFNEKDIVVETTLKSLPVREFSSLKLDDRKVNMILKVIDVSAESLDGALKAYNKKTGKVVDVKKFKNLSSDFKLIYNLTLLCEDSPFSKEIVKVFVSTYDNEGRAFFGNILLNLSGDGQSKSSKGDLDNENSKAFAQFINKLKTKGKLVKA